MNPSPRQLTPTLLATLATLTALSTLLTFPPSAHAATPFKDDLKDCKLPHGQFTIPLANSPEAAAGSLFKFADHSLSTLPNPDPAKPPDRRTAAESLRKKQSADLEFLPGDIPTLWAVSGRIVNVGTCYLHDAAAMKLDRPALIPGNAGQPDGILPNIHEGRTYLLETTDGNFALLRILDLAKSSILIQYVYQPAHSTAFNVKNANPLDTASDAAASEPAPTAPLAETAPAKPADPTAPAPITNTSGIIGATGAPGSVVIRLGAPQEPAVLEPYLSTHLAQRKLLIESRFKTLRAPATTPAEIDKKTQAINDLVSLHADEAADILAEQILFDSRKNPAATIEDGAYPCFDALKKMGKPATNAALKALRLLNLNADGDGTHSPAYRANLLALVIRAVEGNAVAEFLLHHERDLTTDPQRRALYQQLIAPKK